MHSFHGFKGMTTVSLAALAPGLAEALVTTALGLIVAIPAVLAHNVFQRKVDFVENQLLRFCDVFVHHVEAELMGPREGGSNLDVPNGQLGKRIQRP
jgi:biopolymer transport protein TolQ